MDTTTATFDSRSERQLRYITTVAMIPALALLIPSGVITYQVLPAIGLVPMAMSAVSGGAMLWFDIPERRKATTDMVVALSLLAVLIPSWDRSIHFSRYDGAHAAQLAAYAVTPMTVNLIIHAHLAFMRLSALFQPHDCLTCKNHASSLPRWQRPITLTDDIPANGGLSRDPIEPLIRAYADDGARESSEFQTSGCNTPRQSVETLASSARMSRDGAHREPASSAKGSMNLDRGLLE